ncbi:MAG: aspartate aminotransferase family protein [Desulfurococcales archaeon]|nr:aspartate aminotransferase family protein [Desulfurococcales archaeon]
MPSKQDILKELDELSNMDMDPHSGRMFGHIYETGDRDLRRIAEEAYVKYMWKNMLDPTVYPSIIQMEKELVRGMGEYFNLHEEGSGTFTYGGTESIMVAVLSAREYYRSLHGKSAVMEIVLPETAHPAFHKAAFLLGIKTKVVPVDRESFTVSPDRLLGSVSSETGMIVLSAPNYPFGTVDPVKEVGESLTGRNIWLHVDSCIGTLLPFLRMEGENIPPTDFSVDGVYSISTDMHKYGYSPKNGSLVFFRSKDYKTHSLFAYSRWAGYPLINTTILSSRSAGSLAASWAVFKYLGEEGYKRNAIRVRNARDRIIKGLMDIGYRVQGEPLGGIFSFTSSDINVFYLAEEMKEKGWYIQSQPGSTTLNYNPSIHMTIAPIHDDLTDEFLEAVRDSTEAIRDKPLPPENALKFAMQVNLFNRKEEELEDLMEVVADKIGLTEKGLGSEVLVNELMYLFPPDVVEEVLKFFIYYIYS